MSSPSTINSHPSTTLPLIPLHDGRPGLRRGLHAEVREPSPTQVCSPSLAAPKSDGGGTPDTRHSSPILDFIASSEALDRYGEIISAEGWRLDNYRRNPVFQNAHQYGDIIFTLGKALITEIRQRPSTQASGHRTRDSYLFQRVEFATEVNPMAKIAYGLYKGKFLNAVSVGFIPLKWEDSPASSSSSSASSSPPTRRRYLEQELLEVSAVGIPANPEALQLGLKAGAIEKADVRVLLDLVRLACEVQRRSPSDLPVRHQPSPEGEGESWTARPANEAAISSSGSKRFPLPRGEGQGEGEFPSSGTHPLTHSPTLPRQSEATAGHILCGNPAAPNTHARVSGIRSYETQLLQLARALRDLLRR